ncbi:MAG: hypothetical protein AB7E46_01645 [Desulfovibrio sp.]|jgi:hypothetical protein
MSRLHTRLIPWVMLAGFLAAAVALFALAAGPEAVQLRGVLSLASLWEERPAPREVRRVVARVRQAEQEAEHWLLDAAGKRLEAGGKALEARGKSLEALADPEQDSGPEQGEGPLRLLSHRFTETATEFKAVFATDLPPGEGRTYFLRGPARFVVDMRGQWRNSSPRLNTLRGHFINRVVIDSHDSFLRLVFHCSDPALEGKDQLRLERGPTGFTVTILRPR